MELLRPEHLQDFQDSDRCPISVPSSKKESRIRRILRFPFKTRRRKIISFSLLGLLFLLILLVLLIIVIPALLLYPKALALKPEVEELQTALGSKDLDAVEASLSEIEDIFGNLESRYSLLTYLKFVPFMNKYYADGTHLLASGRLGIESSEVVLSALRPHAEVLGFKSEESSFGDQITVEQRLSNILGTLPAVAENLDQVWEDIGEIRAELDQIDPQRYPVEFRGVKVRFWLEESRKILAEAEPLISQGKEILEVTPALLGSPAKRAYLVLFQNGAELRATGGFITGFSLITLKGGKVLQNDFHSGAYFAATYPQELGSPPRPLGKYLNVGKWHFQDSNYAPDFPTTAQTILGVWKKSGLPSVAGVVAINTKIAADLLKVTGPLKLTGYDRDLSGYYWLPEGCRQGGQNFTSTNLICRLEYYVEKAPVAGKHVGAEQRKVILDELSDALINRITSSSAEIWPKLIDFVFEHLAGKNLLIYSRVKKEEDLVKSFGYAGELQEFEGDYLHVNDSNFGGLKTNLYLQESVEQVLERKEDGGWRKTLKIKYYNPTAFDGWLSGNYRNFARICVPKGSRLVRIEGATQIWTSPHTWSKKIENSKGWSESGKTVFGAYFALWPQKNHTLTFVYDLPEGAIGTGEYKLLMQKQSGTNIGLVGLKIGGNMETFDLTTDIEIALAVDE